MRSNKVKILAAAALAVVAFGVSGVLKPVSAGTLDDIKKRGKVVVGTEAAYYPFEFIENGKIVGYDEDVLNAIIKSWGYKMEQLDLPFAGILPGLLQKKFDFVATALLVNPERAKRYAFTMPVAQTKVGFLKRKGDPKVKSADDLSGLTIASGTPPAGPTVIFMHYNDDLKAKGKGAKEQKMFSSSGDTILALANGQVDALVDSTPVMLGAMKKYPGKFEVVGTFGEPFWVGWVTRPEDLDLRDAINVEIRKLRDSGELGVLQKKWFGEAMTIPDSGYLPPDAIK
ncbi:MAG TPA: transporter substrate-binding domain-containing protein [Reyranella sp.]|nr:transporter substrate-binding domain-containing protein [Reyranella sp.]